MKTGALVLLTILLFSFKKSASVDDLIHQEQNHIQFVTELLEQNIKNLSNVEDSNRSIIHIGDSHVQIGELFRGIKNGIADQNIAIEDGWFFPAGLSKDYYHPYFTITKQSSDFKIETIKTKERTLAVGITGRTFELDSVKNKITCSSSKEITNIDFLHKNSAELKILFGRKIHCNRKIRIETHVLSDEFSYTRISFKNPKKDFKLIFKTDKSLKADFYAVRVNQSNKTVSYSNFGVSGSTYKDFLNSEIWEKQLVALKPNIIFVTLGTNDSYVKNLDTTKFKSELLNFTLTVKNILPQTELVFMSAPDTKFKQNYPPSLAFVNRTIFEHCKANNLPFWDWNAVMGGYDSMQNWENNKFSSGDWLHFSAIGYQAFGRNFVKALFEAN